MRRLLFCAECQTVFKTIKPDKEEVKKAQDKLIQDENIKKLVFEGGEATAFIIAAFRCECLNSKTIYTVESGNKEQVKNLNQFN